MRITRSRRFRFVIRSLNNWKTCAGTSRISSCGAGARSSSEWASSRSSMPHLIEVAFKGNRKDFFLWEQDEPPALNAGIIVDADRGEDLGFVYALGELAEKRNAGTPHGYGAAG